MLLFGCGGNATDARQGTMQAASCTLAMQYANGISSGKPINNTPTLSEPRLLSCGISQIQSASVSLCITHARLSELSSELFFNNTPVATLDLQSATVGTTPCLLTGNLYTLPVQITQLNGQWKVGVTDNNSVSNTQGYLVGWSLRVDGLQ